MCEHTCVHVHVYACTLVPPHPKQSAPMQQCFTSVLHFAENPYIFVRTSSEGDIVLISDTSTIFTVTIMSVYTSNGLDIQVPGGSAAPISMTFTLESGVQVPAEVVGMGSSNFVIYDV